MAFANFKMARACCYDLVESSLEGEKNVGEF